MAESLFSGAAKDMYTTPPNSLTNFLARSKHSLSNMDNTPVLSSLRLNTDIPPEPGRRDIPVQLRISISEWSLSSIFFSS